MLGAIHRENLGSSMPKRLMSSGKWRAVGSMHVFVACQIDVLNKQLVSPISWNNLLPETSLGESYVLMIYKHLDAKEKHFLAVEGVYNIISCRK